MSWDAISPPSPKPPRGFVGKKLKAPALPVAPDRSPGVTSAPNDWQASSTTAIPGATLSMAATSTGWP